MLLIIILGIKLSEITDHARKFFSTNDEVQSSGSNCLEPRLDRPFAQFLLEQLQRDSDILPQDGKGNVAASSMGSPVDRIGVDLTKSPTLDALTAESSFKSEILSSALSRNGPLPKDCSIDDSVEPQIRATRERVWYSLTGHAPDSSRVRALDFSLLSMIASYGPRGVLQHELVQASGQDKRSLPNRTDRLSADGYIVKLRVTCVVQGTNALQRKLNTSLCTLARFGESQELLAELSRLDSETRKISKRIRHPEANSTHAKNEQAGQVSSNHYLRRKPVCWTAEENLTNQIFAVIQSTKLCGVTLPSLRNVLFGEHYKKPAESIINKLVQVWQLSQPLHLRHLAVMRDTVLHGKSPVYLHFTYDEYKSLVQKGNRSWSAITTVPANLTLGDDRIADPEVSFGRTSEQQSLRQNDDTDPKERGSSGSKGTDVESIPQVTKQASTNRECRSPLYREISGSSESAGQQSLPPLSIEFVERDSQEDHNQDLLDPGSSSCIAIFKFAKLKHYLELHHTKLEVQALPSSSSKQVRNEHQVAKLGGKKQPRKAHSIKRDEASTIDGGGSIPGSIKGSADASSHEYLADYSIDTTMGHIPVTRMRRTGGSAALLRQEIVMHLIEAAGGVVPGHRAILNDFAAEWNRRGQDGIPEAKTLRKTTEQLSSLGLLNHLTFAYRDVQGEIQTADILSLPSIGQHDSKVLELRKTIEEARQPRAHHTAIKNIRRDASCSGEIHISSRLQRALSPDEACPLVRYEALNSSTPDPSQNILYWPVPVAPEPEALETKTSHNAVESDIELTASYVDHEAQDFTPKQIAKSNPKPRHKKEDSTKRRQPLLHHDKPRRKTCANQPILRREPRAETRYDQEHNQGILIRETALYHQAWTFAPAAKCNLSQEPDYKLQIAKTYVRAHIATPDESLNRKLAEKTLTIFTGNQLEEATNLLLESKTIQFAKESRQGRKYELSDRARSRPERLISVDDFHDASNYAASLDQELRDSSNTDLLPTAKDGDMLAVLSLFAAGEVELVPTNIPTDKFGHTGFDYQTRQMDKTKLFCNVLITSTGRTGGQRDGITHSHSKEAPGRPEGQTLIAGEARIPLWYDIHGELIPTLWVSIATSLLSLLISRPYIRRQDVLSAYHSILEEWEYDLLLQYFQSNGMIEISLDCGECYMVCIPTCLRSRILLDK